MWILVFYYQIISYNVLCTLCTAQYTVLQLTKYIKILKDVLGKMLILVMIFISMAK